MNKRKLHHELSRLRLVPIWGFLVACLVFSLIAVLALRANNQRMIELRQAVFTADEQDGDIEGALRDLRGFVYKHMNTDLAAGPNAVRPPIQLVHLYERLVAAEVAKLGDQNTQVYSDATAYCEARFPAGTLQSGRVPCVQEYLDSHGAKQPNSIPEDLYKFDFVSPRWSPDLAGLSMILAALCFILLLLRLGSEYLIGHELHKHQ